MTERLTLKTLAGILAVFFILLIILAVNRLVWWMKRINKNGIPV